MLLPFPPLPLPRFPRRVAARFFVPSLTQCRFPETAPWSAAAETAETDDRQLSDRTPLHHPGQNISYARRAAPIRIRFAPAGCPTYISRNFAAGSPERFSA